MKLKATKKEMRNGYYTIISIGYCDAQYLLRHESPTAYSCGQNGWSCDYYDIDGVLISTGYSPLSDSNVKHDYKLIREYDEKAKQAINLESYEETVKEITRLLHEFIKTVKN
jgi:hypothetical protein